MSLAISLHVIAAVLWVGGMFFAHMILRPAAATTLEPPLRLHLWIHVFKRFFVVVWICVIALLVTGYWMVLSYYDGFKHVSIAIQIMHILGILMVLVFMHVFFAPYRRLRQAVVVEDFKTGGARLAQIRKLVGFNILLGLAVIIFAAGGRFWG